MFRRSVARPGDPTPLPGAPRTAALTTTIAGAMLLAAPAVAAAHGLSAEAADRSTLGFVPTGIEHMLLGWDHLLFVFGVILVAREPRRAAKLISIFAAGHSFTLILATLAGWTLSATAVDVIVASSVVLVGLLAVRGGTPADWRPIQIGVLLFGLGLATRFHDLGVPDDGLLGKVIAFNVGIELGQLAAIAIVTAIGLAITRTMRRGLTRELVQGFGAVLILAGLIGASILILQGTENTPEVTSSLDGGPAPTRDAACRMREERARDEFGGGHPDKRWYAPTDEAPEQDLGHVIGDGYVIARYRKDLPAADVERLRSTLDGLGSSNIGAPAPAGQSEALVVTTARRVLRCSSPDLATLEEFSTAWMDDVAAGRIQ